MRKKFHLVLVKLCKLSDIVDPQQSDIESFHNTQSKLFGLLPEVFNIISAYPFNVPDRDSALNDNIRRSKSILNALDNKIDYAIFELKHNRRPAYTLQFIFSIPTIFFNFLGLNLKSIKFSNMINLLSWILVFLSKLFSEEIKTLISSLF